MNVSWLKPGGNLRWFRSCPACALAAMGLTLALTGCTMGPDYQRPAVEVPQDWRWKMAEPSDQVPRGEWWAVFEDPALAQVQQAARTNNHDLKAAFYRFEQARAVARVRRSELFPTLDARAGWEDYRTSGNAPSPFPPFTISSFTQDQWSTALDLSYEIDLWGRVRRSFEAARDEALGAEAAYQAVLLALQADVAATYLGIQGADGEIAILKQTIDLRQEALQVIDQRYKAGIVTEFQVERTRVEVESAKAALQRVNQRRAELVNRLAILCGVPPAEFVDQVNPEWGPLPHIAPNLPSTLLERRPDVAEAERNLAARNARIGVAKAAFFPVVRLTASGGYLSGEASELFEWDSHTWSLGPSVSLPVFAGGRNKAELERSRAAYEEGVAQYRQTILVAFREVEDSLASITYLQSRLTSLQEAARAARRAAQLSYSRYSAGAVNFLEVVDSETARLEAELAAEQTSTDQRLAVVRLIKALGGGWQES